MRLFVDEERRERMQGDKVRRQQKEKAKVEYISIDSAKKDG